MQKIFRPVFVLFCMAALVSGCKKEEKVASTVATQETTQIKTESVTEMTMEVTTAGLEEVSGVLSFDGNSIFDGQTAVKKSVNGNTVGNLNNSGIVCETTKKIFYMNQSDEKKLYVMNRDGSEATALGKISGAISLNVMGDYIYYYSNGICRAKIKDGSVEVLNPDNCRNVVVTDNAIFYIKVEGDNSHIYTMGLDGSNPTLLSENLASGLNVSQDKIYYLNNSDSGKIYWMNLDGSDNVEFFDAQNVKELLVENKLIYYVNKNNIICRIRKENKEFKEISTDPCSNINVNSNYLYYYNTKKNAICVSELNGLNEREIMSGNVNAINIISRWIYFFNMDDHQYYRIEKDGSNLQVVQ